MNQIMNEFGEPELLDDLLDHWSSSRHVVEKGLLLNELRKLAAERNLRITLLSGDVHLAAYGFTASTEKYNGLAADPGFMPQVPPTPRMHAIACCGLYALYAVHMHCATLQHKYLECVATLRSALCWHAASSYAQ